MTNVRVNPSHKVRKPSLVPDSEAAQAGTGRERRRQYALSFVRSVLGRTDVALEHALADRVWHVLARIEELESPMRDEWGNWEYAFSERSRAGGRAIPWLDELVLDSDLSRAPASDVEPTWPQGRPFAI